MCRQIRFALRATTNAAFAAREIHENEDSRDFSCRASGPFPHARGACRARQGAADAALCGRDEVSSPHATQTPLIAAGDSTCPARCSWSREAPISHCLCINNSLHPSFPRRPLQRFKIMEQDALRQWPHSLPSQWTTTFAEPEEAAMMSTHCSERFTMLWLSGT